MNVGQLIKRLQKYNPKTMVVVDGYEDDYDDPVVKSVVVVVDGNWNQSTMARVASYDGRHTHAVVEDINKTSAVLIGRGGV